MKKCILLLLSLCIFSSSFSQSCESFDRSLFHMLPDEIPDSINCIDSEGKKQGWWIDYEIKYNAVEIPDELAVGNYVDQYDCGKYKDDVRIGDWERIFNVHLISVMETTNYSYSGDTTTVSILKGPLNSFISTTKDSSFIESKIIDLRERDTLCILCNPNDSESNKNCKLTYKRFEIKQFDQKEFKSVYNAAFLSAYDNEIWQINRKYFLLDFLKSNIWRSSIRIQSGNLLLKDSLHFENFDFSLNYPLNPIIYIRKDKLTILYPKDLNNQNWNSNDDDQTITDTYFIEYEKTNGLLNVYNNDSILKFKIDSRHKQEIILMKQ